MFCSLHCSFHCWVSEITVDIFIPQFAFSSGWPGTHAYRFHSRLSWSCSTLTIISSLTLMSDLILFELETNATTFWTGNKCNKCMNWKQMHATPISGCWTSFGETDRIGRTDTWHAAEATLRYSRNYILKMLSVHARMFYVEHDIKFLWKIECKDESWNQGPAWINLCVEADDSWERWRVPSDWLRRWGHATGNAFWIFDEQQLRKSPKFRVVSSFAHRCRPEITRFRIRDTRSQPISHLGRCLRGRKVECPGGG